MAWTEIATRQAGLISRRQLAAAGVARSTIDRWLSVGRLDRTPTEGVYRIAGAPRTAQEGAWFAALSTRSPVSYLSAAEWWDMPVDGDGLVHITRFDRRRLDWPIGVRVHRVAITQRAITCHRGLWVTSQPETVLDCLGWIAVGRARTLADRAIQQSWLSIHDVVDRLDNQPGRWGNRQLRRLLPAIGDGADAESERRLQRILRRAGITGWVAHLPFVARDRRFEIDLAFPALKIAIEVDGYRYHSGDLRFQADRTKQNALVAAGWRVLRFTWADLDERPDYVIREIMQLLAA